MSTIKHVLVTGGGGYIGSVLVPYLLRKNYKVTVIDRFFFKLNYKLHKNLTIVKDDTQNIDDQTLKKIDCVIDLVAIANDVSGDYFKNQTIKTNYLSRLKQQILQKMAFNNTFYHLRQVYMVLNQIILKLMKILNQLL